MTYFQKHKKNNCTHPMVHLLVFLVQHCFLKHQKQKKINQKQIYSSCMLILWRKRVKKYRPLQVVQLLLQELKLHTHQQNVDGIIYIIFVYYQKMYYIISLRSYNKVAFSLSNFGLINNAALKLLFVYIQTLQLS